MRGLVFCKRTIKEIVRDPLSYIFCLGFPVIMLILMTILNESIPPQAGVSCFELSNLAPGIMIFGQTFVMLFTALQVSKDRSTALIMRLHASPMKPMDFIIGYTLPVLIIAFAQGLITYLCTFIIAAVTGHSISVLGALFSILVSLPAMLLFIGFGLIFGTLVNDKAAPGIASIIICLSGMLGGIWMDVANIGGTIEAIANALPFYHAVSTCRLALNENLCALCKQLCITSAWALGIYVIAVLIMRYRLKKDIR